MPISRSINDLIKKTQEILELCKRNNEPVFLKDDGRDELVIMSRDYFNRLWSLLMTLEEEQMIERGIARQSFHVSSLEELYRKLDEAKVAIQKGDVYTHNEVIARLKDRLNARKVDTV